MIELIPAMIRAVWELIKWCLAFVHYLPFRWWFESSWAFVIHKPVLATMKNNRQEHIDKLFIVAGSLKRDDRAQSKADSFSHRLMVPRLLLTFLLYLSFSNDHNWAVIEILLSLYHNLRGESSKTEFKWCTSFETIAVSHQRCQI